MAIYGARLIAQSLHDMGVQVLFGLPGLPVIDIAQESMNLGINFISFRNEQAAVLAASAYGYLTGRPGVVICVGGPGVLNTIAGIPHAAANAWPLLVLAGSSETHNANKAAFQEMDSISLVTPHVKVALRPPFAHMIPEMVRDAYRAAFFGRPGPCFIDLPANLIMGHHEDVPRKVWKRIEEAPKSCAPEGQIRRVVEVLRTAKSPLVVVGKGAAYARAEGAIRELVERTSLPFLPTPMGKGILPDSSPLNISAARSTAMRETDVVLLLGARLNWILSFGLPPKWSPNVKIIQVDISADELGKNGHDPSLSLLGDVGLVCEQLSSALGSWRFDPKRESKYWKGLQAAKQRNEKKAKAKAENGKVPMTYEHAFAVIKKEVDRLSPPEKGEVVYVSEGANAMDISRSIFTMEYPRTRLDAGTYATMGVGLGYAIAAYAAYNYPNPEGEVLVQAGGSEQGGGKAVGGASATPTPYGGAQGDSSPSSSSAGKLEGGATATPTPYGGASGTSTTSTPVSAGKLEGGATATPTPYGGASGTTTTTSTSKPSKKKIIAIEGDSAFGFSGMEVETMSRYRMPILIFIINNSGLYRGDTASRSDYSLRQDATVAGKPGSDVPAAEVGGVPTGGGLSATSLGYETNYEKMAELAGEGGGWGVVVRTPEELKEATIRGWREERGPVVVNVLVDTTVDLKMDFSWLDMVGPAGKKKEAKL